jgi:cation transport ATPase
MIKSSALRIALGNDGVSIWSSELFGRSEPSTVRDFLSRAFAVREVHGVDLRPAAAFGRIRYVAGRDPASVWKKLSRALGSSDVPAPVTGRPNGPASRADAALLYLDHLQRSPAPVRVSRIGEVLSTWHVRHQGEGTLRLGHPALRNRRDVVFRLEEELASILGVEDFRVSALTARVSIRFDKDATTAEHLARELEKAWPRLLQGLDGPPSRKRLVASFGLLGLSYTGQYVVPALRPVALAGVTLYSSPNVINAAKQLARGQVGISALYTTGLAFMLISGFPFTASVMAALMQFWPHLTHRKIVTSQRRLFAGQRRRATWARLQGADGIEVEVSVHDLQPGDLVTVRSGEVVPVDGVVEDGAASVVDEAAFGGQRGEDRARGDSIAAGALVLDGNLTVRVERAGEHTAASYLASLLPHGTLLGLPSSQEAERIANRNAKPALALSALNLLLTRTLPPSQAAIRPDYATGARLSAQLSALRGIAYGFLGGVSFRNLAALDRLASADVFVIDDSAGLDRRRLQISTVQAVEGVSTELVVGYAAAAYASSRSEQARALVAFAAKHKSVYAPAGSVQASSGVLRYRDSAGNEIEIAGPRYLAVSQREAPRFATRLVRRSRAHQHAPATGSHDEAPALPSVWVLRNGAVIGVVSFARTGELVGKQVVAGLVARNARARVIYVSRGERAEAEKLARALGIGDAHGGLSPAAKAELVRGLGAATLWVGDGSDPDARDAIGASTVSVSVAPLSRSRDDAADILLPYRGVSALPELLNIGRAHAARLADDYRALYAANLSGVAGGFLAGFTTLQVGLLSHAGTGVIYARHALALGRLAAAAEKRRARLKSARAAG